MSVHIKELLTAYRPIAGIWLDGIAVPRSGDASRFRLAELYDQIRRLQSHALVSYKFGFTGTEDFLAPELAQLKYIKERGNKPMEVCVPLNPGWGYVEGEPHMGIDEVIRIYHDIRKLDANLLLNAGPKNDGSILSEDAATLREFGRRVRVSGVA